MAKVSELLATPEQWCQGAYGYDADGNALDRDYLSAAVSLCLDGACAKADNGRAVKIRLEARGFDLWRFNDAPHRAHAEVLALVLEAEAATGGAK